MSLQNKSLEIGTLTGERELKTTPSSVGNI